MNLKHDSCFMFRNSNKGFTLLETIIGIGLFVIIGTAVYFSYSNIFDISIASQINSVTAALSEREVEIIRNMTYEDVGIVGGVPPGVLLASRSVNFDGLPFEVYTTVRNIDDPFDGTFGGNPNDAAPVDYKLVEIRIECPTCPRFFSFKTTTLVAPVVTESATSNGILNVRTFDAFGQPVSGTNVSIVNSSVSPPVNINDTTNSNGLLQVVDIPPGSNYRVIVSKNGYSSDRTYPIGGAQNPNPVKPDAVVVSQQVTDIGFGIDRLSTFNLRTQNKFCQDVSDVNFNNRGSKLIGTNPDVYKYSISAATDQDGNYTSSAIEWDAYTISNTDPSYFISGTSLFNPVPVDPNSTTSVTWMMEAGNLSGILVSVKDNNGQLLNDATVILSKAGFSETRMSGQNFFNQTDWSGMQYSAKSMGIDTDSASGQITLALIDGKYASSSDEWLESESIDMGTGSVTYLNLSWEPENQNPQTTLKFQLASNNDNSSWNFIGPDGTSSTYYDLSSSAISSVHNGNRYFKYKAYLRTENHNFTPILENFNFSFKSACLANGQVFFNGLDSGDYTLDISKIGFQDQQVPVAVGSGWQLQEIVLTP